VGGQPECIFLSDGSGYALYSYLRRPIEGFSTAGRRVFDTETCYGYGGPIFCGDWAAENRIGALRAAQRYLEASGVVAEFIRCRCDGFAADDFRAADYRVLQVRTNVECDLEPGALEAIPPTWHKKARRDINRARRAGLCYRIGGDKEHIAEFARLYRMTAERLDMTPFYRFDLAHFEALLSLEPDLVKLLVVHRTGGAECVSAGILFLGGETAHYHLGASDLAHRAVCPNDFLLFALARVAAEHGMRKIVWGGGLGNDPNDSLQKFKERFATQLVPVHIACRVIDDGAYQDLCTQWEARYPEKRETKRLFLRYRQ
jgi:hypothetical protein